MSIRSYPEDTVTYKCKEWTIRHSEKAQIIWLTPPRGNTIIVYPHTYKVTLIPTYVMRFLERYHLLDGWRLSQREKALERLQALRRKIEDAKDESRRNVWTTAP